MTAREKFRRGQRVRYSEKGMRMLGSRSKLEKSKGYGRVVGFCLKPQLVRVRDDGLRDARAYHMDFWESSDLD